MRAFSVKKKVAFLVYFKTLIVTMITTLKAKVAFFTILLLNETSNFGKYKILTRRSYAAGNKMVTNGNKSRLFGSFLTGLRLQHSVTICIFYGKASNKLNNLALYKLKF